MKSRTGMWIFVVCLFPTLAVPILFAAQNGKNHQPTSTTFDVPGSVYTIPSSINSAGAITGSYDDTSGHDHGFLQARDGTFTTFDPPGSIFIITSGINPAGAITGYYEVFDGTSFNVHGLLRAPGGTIT